MHQIGLISIGTSFNWILILRFEFMLSSFCLAMLIIQREWKSRNHLLTYMEVLNFIYHINSSLQAITWDTSLWHLSWSIVSHCRLTPRQPLLFIVYSLNMPLARRFQYCVLKINIKEKFALPCAKLYCLYPGSNQLHNGWPDSNPPPPLSVFLG